MAAYKYGGLQIWRHTNMAAYKYGGLLPRIYLVRLLIFFQENVTSSMSVHIVTMN